MMPPYWANGRASRRRRFAGAEALLARFAGRPQSPLSGARRRARAARSVPSVERSSSAATRADLAEHRRAWRPCVVGAAVPGRTSVGPGASADPWQLSRYAASRVPTQSSVELISFAVVDLNVDASLLLGVEPLMCSSSAPENALASEHGLEGMRGGAANRKASRSDRVGRRPPHLGTSASTSSSADRRGVGRRWARKTASAE